MKTPAFWYQPATWQSHLLTPISWLYNAATTLHRALRARQPLHTTIPIISIGNLTVGGSGKTPLTALIANHFTQTHTVAIVACQKDEASQLATQCAKATIICHPNKRMGVQQALTHNPTLILVDDAFHRTDIPATVSILTFGPKGIGNGHTLPAGPLREPLSHATRAHLYVTQDTPLPANLPPKPAFRLTRTLNIPETLKNQPLIATAAIAHPQAFFQGLQKAGMNVVATLPLPDHHPYPETTLKRLQNLLTQHQAHLVCTEKDSPKLTSIPHTAVPLTLEGETNTFLNAISYLLNEANAAA